jgi:hypothetical protein
VAVAPGGAAGKAAAVGKKRAAAIGGKKTGLLPAPYIGRLDLQQARTIPLHLSK